MPGLFLLHCPQSCIGIFFRKQSLVCAGLDNAASLHDQDVVGIDNGLQPVCHHQAGFVSGGITQGSQYGLLRVRFQARNGLITDQDARVFQ